MTSPCASGCCRCCAMCCTSPIAPAPPASRQPGTSTPTSATPATVAACLWCSRLRPTAGLRRRALRRDQPRHWQDPPPQSLHAGAGGAERQRCKSLWAIVSNGLTLRILRDNPSLTRPAYVEVDLEASSPKSCYADFSAFWLLGPRQPLWAGPRRRTSRLPVGALAQRARRLASPSRMNLRYQVAEALRALGTGFLAHPAKPTCASACKIRKAAADCRQAFFEELLRLVYRFIFLATVEDRTDRGHRPSASSSRQTRPTLRKRYLAGYS
jgi:hypothetical protein